MKTKLKNWLIGIFAFLFLFCLSFAICGLGILTADAAGTTPIHTFYGTEYTKHTVIVGKEKIEDYEEERYDDLGIRIYGTVNNGKVSEGSTAVLDTNSFYIDFTGAKKYVPADCLKYLDTRYDFEIVDYWNNVVWYSRYHGTSKIDDDTEYYTRTWDINGKSSTTTNSIEENCRFTLSELGKRYFSLNDGYYTLKITRSYFRIAQNDATFVKLATLDAYSTVTLNLTIDTIKPIITMTSRPSGGNVDNGSYVNSTVEFSVRDRNPSKLYYKDPTSDTYIAYSNASCSTTSKVGWYYVYAEDEANNRSVVYSVYYDPNRPVGTIYSQGSAISDETYINTSFMYAATDAESGIEKVYYKTPISSNYQEYTSGTIIPSTAGDGWYYFYAVDKAGNKSSTVSVYLETQAPLFSMYRNGTRVYSHSITEGGTFQTNVYFNRYDMIRLSCDTSSGKVSCNYELNRDLLLSGDPLEAIQCIELTSATGIKCNFFYRIAQSGPEFWVNGLYYPHGADVFFSEDVLVNWKCDPIFEDTGDTGLFLRAEGGENFEEFIKYSEATERVLITPEGTETKYILTLNDRAGNESTFIVYIDKAPPTGRWISGEKTLADGGYTNQPLRFEFEKTGIGAKYSYNGGEYLKLTSGDTFTEDGTYIVVLTDNVGNKSAFTAYIDTVPPTGQIYANYLPVGNGKITNGKIYFSWDGEASVKVNGKPYIKNSVIFEDGEYTFVLTDLAGNSATYTITLDNKAPTYNSDKLESSQQMISKWYLVIIDDKKYSFADYDEALTFASENEFAACVTVLYLENIEDFNQQHLVADNGNAENTDDEVRTGEYWLYKSKANPNSQLYYFDRNLLDESVAYYAKDSVMAVNYYMFDGKNEYGIPSHGMSDNIWTTSDGNKVPVLNGFVFEEIDSVKLYAELVGGDGTRFEVEFGITFGEQLTSGGLYKLIELDIAGNERMYYGYLDLFTPKLEVSATIYGNTEPTELRISEDGLTGIAAYYYEKFNVNAIIDADKWAVLSVKNGSKTEYYTFGDPLPTLSVGGEYLVSVYDRLGNGYAFTVYIVGNEANVTFTPNREHTAFDVEITLEQSFDTLVTLDIYKDGTRLDGVVVETLRYTFDKTGHYTLILRDNFGRTIEKHYEFQKALPEGKLVGVINGGRTNGEVSFEYNLLKYGVAVYKNENLIFTDFEGHINFMEDGVYLIRLVNLTDEDNFCIYEFEIDTAAPVIILIGCVNGETTNRDITVSWTDAGATNATSTLNGGKIFKFEAGKVFTEEGEYLILVTDDVGNQSSVRFTIDKTLEYRILIGGKTDSGAELTNQDVTVLNDETLFISVTRNGTTYPYEFRETISLEGNYAIKIFDDYGNSAVFRITVDKSVDYETNVGNGVISDADVVITAREELTVLVTKDGKNYDYILGTALTESGNYRVVLRDEAGNEKSFSFQIVKGARTSLEYTLGENVEIVSIVKDGEALEVTGNSLCFTDDGSYVVVCKAEGKEYAFTLTLDTTAPTLTLTGVEDGGKSPGPVIVGELSEEGALEVYCNGNRIDYRIGDELSQSGDYELKVKDLIGNERIYRFTLETPIPAQSRGHAGVIILSVCGVLVVGGAITFIVLKKRKIF